MQSEQLRDTIVNALEDMKGKDIQVLDVRALTDITDFMVITSGTSDRHIRAMADRVTETLRNHDVRPLGIEGEEHGDWVLIDFGDALVHLMRPDTRKFYDLESLWGEDVAALVRQHRDNAAE